MSLWAQVFVNRASFCPENLQRVSESHVSCLLNTKNAPLISNKWRTRQTGSIPCHSLTLSAVHVIKWWGSPGTCNVKIVWNLFLIWLFFIFNQNRQPGFIGSHRGSYQIHENSHRPRGWSVTPGNLWSLRKICVPQSFGKWLQEVAGYCWV